MQEVSISHVYAAMNRRGKYPVSEVFSNNIVNQCIQRGTDEVGDLLHHWTIVNSYLPYISGFFVWDMVSLGLVVLYQNARKEPISNSLIGDKMEFLDHIRISRKSRFGSPG